MLTKEEVLRGVKELVENNQLSKADIMATLNESAVTIKRENISIIDILYYIGGAIVFMGIAIFVFQNWSSLNSFSRIISTLGSAVAAYFVAILFSANKKTEGISVAFHLVSALVMPLGLLVTFHEAGSNLSTNEMQSWVSAILLAVYLSSLAIFKKDLFIFFSVIFGTWFFFSFTNFLLDGSLILGTHFLEYRILLVGLTYILLGYYFSESPRRGLTGILYGSGILGILGAALSLGGWKPNQSAFWEIVYPGLIFATLFLSVHLRSTSFLTFGTIFLMAYITKITAEYFSSSLGWPLSLVVIGLLLIGAGYLFVFLKNNYIRKTA
ncbi:MAG: hypothetical protein Q8Q48_03920 [Candidatus Staskawiczbacteria bacterium]|nr:hypothetical protein [Candidatus Staskawiczbacteria bacterium]